MRWYVMQSLKHHKWVLAVMSEDFSEYEVTDVMSDFVEQVVQWADYLNGKTKEPGTKDPELAGFLEELRQRYKKS